MMSTQRMEVAHASQVGQVRRFVQESAQRLGAPDGRAGEAAIVATELATNLVKHGLGGEILLREIRQADGTAALEIHALDRGPGMSSVSACLRDGYSTAGSAGTGLGAVQRMAGQFQILSSPGQGTVVWVSLPLVSTQSPMTAASSFECGGISVALKGEELCGDAWDCLDSAGGGLQVLVADGLGHGPFAAEASREAVTIFRKHSTAGPADCLSLMHQALFKTRGAAASLVRLDPAARLLTSAGVGNVAMRTLGHTGSRSLAGELGTLGGNVRRVQQQSHAWEADTLVILHSDGISSRWDLEKYPGLIRRHPGLIAGVIYRDFRHQHDDATVVVIRQSPS